MVKDMKKNKVIISSRTVLDTMVEVKKWLKLAEKYWKICYGGDYEKSSELGAIATVIRNTEDAGRIKRAMLTDTEKVMLQQLLLLAHCPPCCSLIGKTYNFN